MPGDPHRPRHPQAQAGDAEPSVITLQGGGSILLQPFDGEHGVIGITDDGTELVLLNREEAIALGWKILAMAYRGAS
jgi:hypothetical protein